MTSLSIRAFTLEIEREPQSLDELVPEYLSAVPADPYGNGPLIYRRDENSYRLYSVGRNRRDDGVLRVTADEYFYGGQGDYFLDGFAEP